MVISLWCGLRFPTMMFCNLVFLQDRFYAVNYCNTLIDNFLSSASMAHGYTWTYEQDNAPIHTTRLTERFFSDHIVDVMKWAAGSPDLNPIDNLWSILVRRVCANSRQLETVQGLKWALTDFW